MCALRGLERSARAAQSMLGNARCTARTAVTHSLNSKEPGHELRHYGPVYNSRLLFSAALLTGKYSPRTARHPGLTEQVFIGSQKRCWSDTCQRIKRGEHHGWDSLADAESSASRHAERQPGKVAAT